MCITNNNPVIRNYNHDILTMTLVYQIDRLTNLDSCFFDVNALDVARLATTKRYRIM